MNLKKKIKMILTTIDDELYIFALAPKETCRIPGFAMTRWQNKKTKSINPSMVVDNLNNSVIDIKTVYFRSVYFSSGLILWASSHECMSTHRIQLTIPNSPSAKQETNILSKPCGVYKTRKLQFQPHTLQLDGEINSNWAKTHDETMDCRSRRQLMKKHFIFSCWPSVGIGLTCVAFGRRNHCWAEVGPPHSIGRTWI